MESEWQGHNPFRGVLQPFRRTMDKFNYVARVHGNTGNGSGEMRNQKTIEALKIPWVLVCLLAP